jgi:4-diphosphocytidyl-2-C-methyl-D-erythritol kinase
LNIVGASNDLLENNIVIRAIKLLEAETGFNLNTKITLQKNIPIGAGLGGGSSDGASTLIAANKFFNLNLSICDLEKLALELGSDVPLFLYNYPTIGKSRGELLEQIELKIEYPILLVNPGIHISTKDAFSNIAPKPCSYNYPDILKMDLTDWNQKLSNDFEASVFKLYPEIENIKNTLNKNGSLFSLMSGTGSTVYGIFESIEKAEKVIRLFPSSYFTFIGNLK